MTRQQKIQAAIDALPKLAPVEGGGVAMHAYDEHGDHIFTWETKAGIGDDAFALQTVISAAPELAEEVVRLRDLVKDAYMKGALDQSHRCDLTGPTRSWKSSGFPEKIEKGAF